MKILFLLLFISIQTATAAELPANFANQNFISSNIDLEPWAALNNDAKLIWKKLLNCANNNEIEAKNIYASAENICDLKQEIIILHKQVENILLSSSFRFPGKNNTAEEFVKTQLQFEPLLVQIILEEASLFVRFSVHKKIKRTKQSVRIWNEGDIPWIEKPYREIIGVGIENKISEESIFFQNFLDESVFLNTYLFDLQGKQLKPDEIIATFLVNLYTILLLNINSAGLWDYEGSRLLFLIAYQPICENNYASQLPTTLRNFINIDNVSDSEQINHADVVSFFRNLGSNYGLRTNIEDISKP